jgi:threonine/homoserine/homoserine lactone efflux protein
MPLPPPSEESSMTVHGALALVLATFIFAAIPGPGVTAVIAQALARGRRHALLWGLGLIAGDACYLLVAMLGLSWVAGQIGGGFVVLKWLGAGYLAYLGLRYLFAARAEAGTGAEAEAPPRGVSGRTFLSALAMSLGNPKVIAFYCGFLPGFVDLPSLSGADMALVAALILPTCYAVLAGYAWLAARGRGVLAGGRAMAWARRGAGAVMLGTAAAVVAE